MSLGTLTPLKGSMALRALAVRAVRWQLADGFRGSITPAYTADHRPKRRESRPGGASFKRITSTTERAESRRLDKNILTVKQNTCYQVVN